jgi:hypothetical protein
MPFAKAGLLVGSGEATQADLQVIRQAGLEALKLRAIANPPSDVPVYRETGVETFLVQLLSPEPATIPTSPQRFVDYFAPAVEGFIRANVYDFEIHGEPDLAGRGYGVSWVNAAAFGEWFVRVVEILKATFGPQVRAGFPGLTPPPPRPTGVNPVVSQAEFLASCSAAVRQADFLCCNIYWSSAEEMRAWDGGMRFIHQYLEAFPNLPLVISEFANVNPATPSKIKGDQYAEFYFTCSQYDECFQEWPANRVAWPRLQAAYAFLLRSPDPAYSSMVWLADEMPRPVVASVASRPRMPHPAALRLSWPTEFRYYTQYYGENQQRYYQTSWNHSLRGGHNGVDLHVNYQTPERSPIRSCLDGVVTQKELRETGYGHHVCIESQVEGIGRVTLLYAHMSHIIVEKGEAVQAGQVIGAAGMTGATSGPHLHLSLKIEGLRLPANGDHLNPRPYLDPLPRPRGHPRVQYSRTYVLLPPGADEAWAQAVVDAMWESRRFTIGGSADDAGVGDLDYRRVIAVNPTAWGGDLGAFFELYYPGIIYLPLEAENPAALRAALATIPEMPTQPPPQPPQPRGRPRVPYERTYVLLPPGADASWASAVITATWNRRRFTVGGSADDAGIGDLPYRRVLAVNPAAWGGDLCAFFETYYPGVICIPLEAATPQTLAERLEQF